MKQNISLNSRQPAESDKFSVCRKKIKTLPKTGNKTEVFFLSLRSHPVRQSKLKVRANKSRSHWLITTLCAGRTIFKSQHCFYLCNSKWIESFSLFSASVTSLLLRIWNKLSVNCQWVRQYGQEESNIEVIACYKEARAFAPQLVAVKKLTNDFSRNEETTSIAGTSRVSEFYTPTPLGLTETNWRLGAGHFTRDPRF